MLTDKLFSNDFISKLKQKDSLLILKHLNEHGVLLECSPENETYLSNKYKIAKYLGTIRRIDVACVVLNHLNIPVFLLNHFGSDYLKEKYLKRALAADCVGAIGITEPTGGSNLTETVEMTYRETDDGFVINGEKKYIINIPSAEFVIVFAKCFQVPSCYSLFVLPTSIKNIELYELDCMGLPYCHIGGLKATDCFIPKACLVGKEGRGFMYLLNALSEERLIGCASLIYFTYEVLKETYQHLVSRKIYDSHQYNLQSIKFDFADLYAEFKAIDEYIKTAIRNWDMKNKKTQQISAQIKILSMTLADKTIRKCTQWFGGKFYLMENWISSAFLTIQNGKYFAGSPAIMKEIVGQLL